MESLQSSIADLTKDRDSLRLQLQSAESKLAEETRERAVAAALGKQVTAAMEVTQTEAKVLPFSCRPQPLLSLQ